MRTKHMPILSMILGAVLLLAGVVAYVLTVDPAPRANDHRIVKRPDGTYQIQYYWPHPTWIDLGTMPGFTTLESARSTLASIEGTTAQPEVVP